jgi:hypothetical protein
VADDAEERQRSAEELRRAIDERSAGSAEEPASPREFIARKMAEAAAADDPASPDEAPEPELGKGDVD